MFYNIPKDIRNILTIQNAKSDLLAVMIIKMKIFKTKISTEG